MVSTPNTVQRLLINLDRNMVPRSDKTFRGILVLEIILRKHCAASWADAVRMSGHRLDKHMYVNINFESRTFAFG